MSLKEIKVSICIPCYEQPANLYKCLQSIKEQSFKDFEVIITDDSKIYDLREVIKDFEEDFEIQYFKNLTSKGSPENWNESLRHAKGKYIKILHHDDYLKESDSLEQMVKLLQNNSECKVAFCSSYHVDNKGEYISSHILTKTNMHMVQKDANNLYKGNVIGAPSAMIYHRDINIFFDRRMKWLVDIDFYIQVLKNNRFVYTEKELVAINIGEEQRVTKICENDATISIYEHMILLEKLNFATLAFSYQIYLVKIFLKFEIFTPEQLSKCGYEGDLTLVLNLFKYVRWLHPLYKIVKKFK